jgi:methylenetetrahydrofolate reductase (NADPH)
LFNQDMTMRVDAARAIRQSGFVPVPIIAARRLESAGMLRDYLAALQAADASGSVLVVGGDPGHPLGRYPDAGSVIGSGMLEEHGVREVSVAGHPGGLPAVADSVLWQALADKITALERRRIGGTMVRRARPSERATAADGRVLVRRRRDRARCQEVRVLAPVGLQ